MRKSFNKAIRCFFVILFVLATTVSMYQPGQVEASNKIEYQNLFDKRNGDNWLQSLTYNGTKLTNTSAYANLFTTHKIAAKKGDTLYWGLAGKDAYVMETYDQNDQVVDRQVQSKGDVNYQAIDLDTTVSCAGGAMLNEAKASFKITNDKVAYARILGNISTIDNFMVFKNLPNGLEDWPSQYIAFEREADPNNPLDGKSAIFFGDSITDCSFKDPDHYRWGWAGRIGTKNNMEWKNAGSDGATISIGYPANPKNRIIKELQENTASYDYVILHGGMNDSLKPNPIGEISNSFDITDFDVNTMAGALEELFYTATKQYSGSKIGYIINYATPNSTCGGDTANNEAYFSMIKEICKKWNIPYIDLFSGGVIQDNEFKSYSYDILKLNTAEYLYGNDKGEIHIGSKGYDVIYPYIESWMKTLEVYTNDFTEAIIDDNTVGSDINQITYSGSWKSGPNANCYMNTEHYVNYDKANEASYTMKFNGSKVELYGGKDRGHGIYEVFIDGISQGFADAYGESRKDQQLIFSSKLLENREHTMKVVITGDKNEQALRNDGHLDFIKVYESNHNKQGIHIVASDFTLTAGESKALTTRVDGSDLKDKEILWQSENQDVATVDAQGIVRAESNGTTAITASISGTDFVSDPILVTVEGNDIAKHVRMVDDLITMNGFSFTYEGAWAYDQNYPSLFYNGTNHYSTAKLQNGSPVSATLEFSGPGIEVYGNLQSDQGIYEIYLDDVLVAEKDAYSASRVTQQLIFEKKDLEDKEHTLIIKSTERKNDRSSGTSISIDYAKVYFNDIAATNFTITQTDLTLDTGSNFTLDVVYEPRYANICDIDWSSSDPSIAAVDKNGVISAKSVGSVEIIGLLANGIKKVTHVNVIDENNPLHAMFGNTNVHYLQKNYDDIVKRFAYENKKYNSDFAWKRDQINAEIVTFTKDKGVKGVSITANDFVNSNGTVFSKDQISINFLRETSVGDGRGGNMASSNHTDIPDIIYKNDPKDIAEKRIQSAWMNIEVPAETEAGIYHGTISIKGENMESISLPYTFEVINLTQPDVQNYQGGVELWEYPYAVAKYYNIPDSELYGEKHISLLRENLKEYAEMGGNTITTAITEYPWDRNNPYDYPSTIKWTKKSDGTFTFDYSQFDAWVSLNLEYGIDDKLKCFSMSPYHAMVYFDEAQGKIVEETITVGSDRWKQVWGQFLSSFIPHLDEKGWFDMTYSAMDEVGQNQINAVYELLQKYENKDGKHLKVAAAVNYGGTTQATLDRVNDISIALSHVGTKQDAQAIADDRREKGLYTSFYTCTGIYPNSFGLSDPGESAWTFWYNAAAGMDGFLRWAYDNWLYTPYTNLDWKFWESGDTMMIYPEEDKTVENPKIYTTPRWEKLKEGKRDIEKMYYLQDHYETLTEDIKTALATVETAQGSTSAYGGVYAANQASKDKINNEVLRMRNILKEYSVRAVDMEAKTYTIDVQKNIDIAGSVTGAGEFKPQTEVVLTATANEGYAFVNWTKDGIEVGKENSLTITVNESAVYCANFRKVENTTVMKDILKQLIDKTEEIAPESYLQTLSPKVAEMIRTCLEEAKAVYNDLDASNDAYMNAWLNLANALHYADFKADKNDLQTLINACNDLKEEDYIAGFDALKTALAQAQSVYDDENALQARIDTAYANLLNAKKALVANENTAKKDLADLVALFEDLDSSKYCDNAAWAAFIKAMNDAKAVLVNNDATVSEISTALRALTSAYEDIRLLPDEDALAQLQAFLDKVGSLDLTMYSKENAARFMAAAGNVRSMINDVNTFDAGIFNEIAAINTIIDQEQIIIPVDPTPGVDNPTVAPEENETPAVPTSPESSVNGTTKPGMTKTGDTTNAIGLGAMFLASAGAFLRLKKRVKSAK